MPGSFHPHPGPVHPSARNNMIFNRVKNFVIRGTRLPPAHPVSCRRRGKQKKKKTTSFRHKSANAICFKKNIHIYKQLRVNATQSKKKKLFSQLNRSNPVGEINRNAFERQSYNNHNGQRKRPGKRVRFYAAYVLDNPHSIELSKKKKVSELF